MTEATTTRHPSQRPHFAAWFEDRLVAAQSSLLRRAGWRPRVEPFIGYGAVGPGVPNRVRVLARVVLAPPHRGPATAGLPEPVPDRRGFRSYLTAQAPREAVRIRFAGTAVDVVADRGGYIDVDLDLPDGVALAPGAHEATLAPAGVPGAAVAAPVLLVDAATPLGVVSDIDDTTMVTAVPRLFLAAWNTFVRHTSARRAVEGMPELYRRLAAAHPGAPFFYVSTGAWNTARTLRAFLARHGYPAGPLLLTDWGPTNTGWFRSGPHHKDACLARLMREFPRTRWLLVGDDGQHDPEIYARATRRRPGRVAAVAIRELTTAQQVLASGATTPAATRAQGDRASGEVPYVGAGDGFALADGLAARAPEVLPGDEAG
ncbi:App1 family protein [Myceligenerans crystallogenes]|uniref:DUF2183 domain-containing protein n=1 Tax=Myceligenerans crystallogenes TaxID=316335 RepID=A0ABN2NIY0_9MICO